MFHNKISWILIMFISIFGFGAKASKSADKQAEEADALIKSGESLEKACEAFEKLVVLSPDSKKAAGFLGNYYASAYCVQFNLEKAVGWYRKSNLTESQIAHQLFLIGDREGTSVDSKDSSLTPNQTKQIFNKSKEMGYKPSELELKKIAPEFKGIFTK